VKKISNARIIRNSIISLAAVAVISLPLTASASPRAESVANTSLLRSEWVPQVDNSPDALYGKLKSRSHEVCGSSDLHITGDVRRSAQIDECYEGTLTAAVQRLDNPEVEKLHQN
jgi:hypothetical protein